MTNADYRGGGSSMENIKLILSLCVFGAMVALCFVRFDWAGMSGLACGAIGFVGWFFTPGSTTWGERLGNGYIGAFSGLCLGFAIGGVAQIIAHQLQAG